MRLKKCPVGKAALTAALSLTLLLCAAPTVVAQEDIDLDELLAGALQANIQDKYGLADSLNSALSEVRQQAVAAAGEFGPDAINVIAPLLDSDKTAVVEATESALQEIVGNAAAASETQQEASRALAFEATRVDNRNPLLQLLGEYGSYQALEILWRISQNYEDSYEAAIDAIAQIGERTDHHHLMGLSLGMITAFRTEQGPKRQVMLRAMGRIAMDDFVPHLVWEVNNGPDKEPAIEALGKIAHPDAYEVVRAYYEEHWSDTALEALAAIMEQLPLSRARAEYAELAHESYPMEAQVVGVQGLGQVATVDTLGELIPFLGAYHDAVRDAAHRALVELEGEQVTTRLVILALQAGADAKPALLRVLHERDPESGRAAAEAALTDDAASVRVAAMALLGQEPTPEHEQTYLEGARRGSPETRQLALQGYLTLAEAALAEGNTVKARNMFHRSLSMALEDQERLRTLEGLTEIASPETLVYLEGMAHRESIQPALAQCAVAIARQVASSDAMLAREIYTGILDVGLQTRNIHSLSTEERAILNVVQDELRGLGADINVLHELGIVSNWHVIGPFPFEDFDAAHPPEEAAFDADATYSGAGSQEVGWHQISVEAFPGVVQLHPLLRPNRNVVAYARAVVHLDAGVQSYVKVGSDDGVKVWVNGQLVHENDVERELRMDQDVKPVNLQAGENEILLKITQTSGEWQYIVRLTNRQNTPLQFDN